MKLLMCNLYKKNRGNEIESHHLGTAFHGHATANELFKHVCLALDNANLSYQNLLRLGSDGPNVIKKLGVS